MFSNDSNLTADWKREIVILWFVIVSTDQLRRLKTEEKRRYCEYYVLIYFAIRDFWWNPVDEYSYLLEWKIFFFRFMRK